MEGQTTVATQVNPAAATELRAVLAEVGARVSDVFGADSMLWVEGATEEACFPLIRERGRQSTDRATGTVILGVTHTADFEPGDAQATVEIYRRLTTAQALMPQAVGFIFDADGRSPEGQREIARRSGDLVRFLPRRMFENYILNPGAIAAALKELDNQRAGPPIASTDVSGWLNQHKWDAEYFDRPVAPELRTDEVLWVRSVHGAKLLKKAFRDLTETRVSYDKVRHGLMLTTWLCANDFDSLRDIDALIREAVAKVA